MDTFLVSPTGNYWLNEFTYNPEEINQFSMSRIVGLGLSLINEFNSGVSLKSNNSFIINEYRSNDDLNNEEKIYSKNNYLSDSNINIKEKKEEIKENLKDKNSDIQTDENQIKDKKGFKMDTSFLDLN